MTNYKDLKIGVLALQGDFERHQYQLSLLGVKNSLVKLPNDLNNIDALIIPGGESTTMDKLLDRYNLRFPLIEFSKKHPLWGTCAGMILLAKKIEDNQAGVTPLGLMDIDVARIGYGRQVFSFETELKAQLNKHQIDLKVSFIRAPIITRIGAKVKTLAVYENKPVLVTENNIMASSFHTELNDDTTLLKYFLDEFLLS